MRQEDREDAAEPPILYTPPSPLGVWHRAIGWGTFLIALLVRAAFLKQLQTSRLWEDLPGDAAMYRDWAAKIAAGQWVPAGAYEWSPLYAWFLAACFRLFGSGLMAPRLLQAVVGAATCVLVYRIGRQAFSPAAGLIAALVACVHGPSLFLDAAILPEVLAFFLSAAALYQIFAANASQRGLLASSGLCLGLAASARDSMIRVVPIIALWLILDPWLRGERAPGRARESAGRLATFALGLGLVLAPMAARNYHASGEFVLLTTGGGGPAVIADDVRYREAVPILLVADPVGWLLVPVAAAGLALSLARWREAFCFYLLIAGYAASTLLDFPAVPGLVLIPIALVLAGSGIEQTARAAAGRRWLRLLLAAAAFLGALLFAPAIL
ncbi:MAG TPA: glycosyltransferase family 39 protein [Candidatus Polarisedimenticolia bacterium]|jgi:4-amino-4-deoxy-L-arabinose transferase-like glycosyltransferase